MYIKVESLAKSALSGKGSIGSFSNKSGKGNENGRKQ